MLQFETTLLKNGATTDQEKADALEIEGNRRQRIADLLKGNANLLPQFRVSKEAASAIADAQAGLEGQAKAQERLNTKIREEGEARRAAIEAAREAAAAAREAYADAGREWGENNAASVVNRAAIGEEIDYRRQNPSASDEEVENHMAVRNAFQERFNALTKAGTPVVGEMAAAVLAMIGATVTAGQENLNQVFARRLALLKDIQNVRRESKDALDGLQLETHLLDGGAKPEAIERAKIEAARAAELAKIRDTYKGDDNLDERVRLAQSGYEAQDARDVAHKGAEARGRVSDYLAEIGDRSAAAARTIGGKTGGIADQIDEIRRNLKRQKWSDEDIEKIVPATRAAIKAEAMARDVADIMGGMREQFTGILAGFEKDGMGHFAKIFDGIYDRFKQWGDKMVSDAIWNQLSGLFTKLVGGALGASMGVPAAASVLGSVTPFSPIGPPKIDGSFAIGIDRVPRTMVAQIHADEAVLNAQEAATWRQENRRRAASGAAQNASGAGGGNAGGGAPIQVHGDIIIQEARKPRETARAVGGAIRSRSEMRRGLAMEATGGTDEF